MAEPHETRTVCPYCGVGCGLLARTRDGRLHSVAGDPDHPVNRGRVCSKPLALPSAVRSADRATEPLRRCARDERWRRSGWEEVMPWLATRLLNIRERHGTDAIAFYVSGQLMTEDYYVVNKLAKGFLGTNNVDSNSRLCMSSAVAGYRGSFGSDGPPPAYADIDCADCFLLLGTNMPACHPILWARVRERQRAGASLVVVDPRRTEAAEAADVHLAIAPGTDLALLNAMLAVVEREGLVATEYVALHTEGYEAAMKVAREWTPERAAAVCGVDADQIVAASRLFARAPAAMALWSMGANQSSVGTLKNHALNNMCLVTGQIGRPGAGPLSLTGQPNAMGGREVGGLAELLPGYRMVASADDRAEMSELWNLPAAAAGISSRPGLHATELFEALEDGRVKAVWICATNPVVSLPDAARIRRSLGQAELVVCQDAYHPTETSALAHVLLPAAQWPEKEGTMTNSERRVGLVRKVLDPAGEALPDWEIFARLGRELGYPEHFAWTSAAQVHDEFTACTAGRPCDQSGISHQRLRREGGLQWPCTAQASSHAGTQRLYEDGRFATPSGRARIVPTPHATPVEAVNARFPLVLTTGRVSSQWHTMTRTGKSQSLLRADPEPFVEIHSLDAEGAGIIDGSLTRIVSRRGSAIVRARVTRVVAPGTIFAPFHWGALHAPPGAGTVNDVTISATDPTSHQPELKACAARVEPARRAIEATHGARPCRSARTRDGRLVVVGGGMAGLAAVEAAFENRDPERWQVTIIGRESQPPYNRVQLTRLLAEDDAENALALRTAGWYADRDIELLTATEVVDVDVARRAVALRPGNRRIDYDALVLATGSLPFVPPMQGLPRDGVHVLRTIDDANAVLASSRKARRATVVGGGLLGLEIASTLARRGLAVTVIDAANRLMRAQLDEEPALMLKRQLQRDGIEILLGRTPRAILGDERVTAVALTSGERVCADLVLIAAGVKPDVALARRIGLEVDRGIVVDDELRTSSRAVWAVGECAEHRGQLHGVWAPIAEQARVVGASVAGIPAGFHGRVPATTLKISGIDLFVAGHAKTERGLSRALVERQDGVFRKAVLEHGQIISAVVLGDRAAGAHLQRLLDDRDDAGAGDFASFHASAGPSPADVVCGCNAVTRHTILAAARERPRSTVADIAHTTGAASVCGGCAQELGEILAELAP